MDTHATVLHAEDGTYFHTYESLTAAQAYVVDQMGYGEGFTPEVGRSYTDDWGRTVYLMTIEDYREHHTYPDGHHESGWF